MPLPGSFQARAHKGLLILLLLVQCSPDLPTLENIDTKAWKDDRNGCHGERSKMSGAILLESQKLKGLTEMQVIELLGKSDVNELYERNQKFYHFYIDAGPACSNADTAALRLTLRFNATGRAQLVSVDAVGK